jgi:hypothetical protein
VAESAASNVKPSPSVQSNSAAPLPQKVRPSADSMVEPQLALRLNKADSVAPRLKPFTATKLAKRELNELMLCVNSVL